jgi:uncharacterized protein YndB with AHSA1/START domain
MNDLTLTKPPITKTGMLIRKPPAVVFEEFIDPAITTRFWFTKGSGRLEVGKQVQWDWEMYNISVPVTAKAIEPHTRIVIVWPGYSGESTVEWVFTPYEQGSTFVSITESGFTGDGDSLVQQVTGSTQGFSLVLAGAKAWLEHGIELNLVADRYPKGIEEH